MRKVPKFVKWADKDIIADARERVIKKYGIDGLKTNIDMSILDFEELRDMATVVSEFGFDHELYENIPYEQQKNIKDKLNSEFDSRMGEAVQIFLIVGLKKKEIFINARMKNVRAKYSMAIFMIGVMVI